MLRRAFLQSPAAFLCARRALAQPRPKPNVLLLIASEWRAQDLPGANPAVLAPHLARLASEGVQLGRAYASCPLSSPARAALLTGRFPHACGVTADNVPLPPEQSTIAAAFEAAGYRTGYIGLWHLDGAASPGFVPPGPRRRGFEYWAAFNRGYRYYNSLYFRDAPEPIAAAGFEPDYQTALAAGFIEQNRRVPFFLAVAWGAPHPPRLPPPRAAQAYDPDKIQVRANVPPELEAKTRNACAGYYALCSSLDDQVGRLAAALEANGIARDTIVVFTSDTGVMLGSHGFEGGGRPFEEALRVPLIVRYPALLAPAGARELMASSVDLAPTLLRLCGLEIPAGVQGLDLSAAMAGAPGGGRQAVFSEGRAESAGDEWRAVVRGLDKMVVNRNLQATHLFNLGQDPFEMENLAAQPSFELKRDELRALLKDWMRRSGDRMDASGLKKRARLDSRLQ